LNREQDISWNVKNGAGARDLKGYLWVNMQMKRGD